MLGPAEFRVVVKGLKTAGPAAKNRIAPYHVHHAEKTGELGLHFRKKNGNAAHFDRGRKYGRGD